MRIRISISFLAYIDQARMTLADLCRYKFQVWDKKLPESRTLKAIWADRFFTLRNHVIHGDTVHANGIAAGPKLFSPPKLGPWRAKSLSLLDGPG